MNGGRNWLAIGLVVSVGLNLFLVGIAAGRHLAPQPHREWHEAGGGPRDRGGAPSFIVRRIVEQLPPEERPQLDRELETRRAAMGAAAGQVREARQRVREALLKEPFDPRALDAAFSDLRSGAMESQRPAHDAMVAAAGRLTPEARRRLAEFRPEGRPR